MATLLMAWEIGGGMGHLVPLAQLAEPLLARGHELHLALRDLSSARSALGPLADSPRLHLWQAPLWLPPLQGLPPPASYAELLFTAGYLDAGRLRGLVQAWRQLLDAIRPTLLLADHAPTALLASRGRPLRRATLGTGFFQPPPDMPMPPFREWDPVNPQQLAQSEALVLATCNAVLQAEGLPPLAALGELLDVDECFLLGWPELDPYGHGPVGRPGGHYRGPLPTRTQGPPALFPEGDGPALFAYLKSDYVAIESVLQQLAKAPCRTLAHVRGLSPAQRQRFQSTRLRFSRGAVSMDDVLAQADAVLCHPGAGTVHSTLQAARPLLMLPLHAEQLLLARRVAACEAGMHLMPPEVPARFGPTLKKLLASPAMREAAATLAARHAPERELDVLGDLVSRCEQLATSEG